jgi:PAS domain S-box-containing protein
VAASPKPRFVLPENSLRMALAAAQAGIWEWHLDTNESFWSEEVWSLFGLDRDSVTPSFDQWLHAIHPEDRTYARQTVNAASQCHVPFEIEWRTNPELGPIRWLLSRGQPAKPRGKGRATYTGIVMDITARKRAEHTAHKLNETLEQRVAERTAALSEHERLLQSILDGVPGLVGYWTKDLINRFANKTYGEWFGMTPQQIRHRHIKDLLGPELFERDLPWMEAALRGQRQRVEYATLAPGDDETHRYSEAHYLPDIVDGQVQGFLVIVFDISQVKQAELAAEKANQAKSEFLANISHEVRTPLNAMFGLAQVGARHTAGTPTERTFDQILDAAQHLLELVNDVLDFSKIEAGKLDLHFERVNLGDVLEHVMALQSVRAHAKGLTLSIKEAPHVPQYYHGDATRLSQILLNLLSNAIKFTPHGEISIELAYQAPELSISVRDTGMGMSPAKLQRLFKPFVQVHGNHPSQAGGTGLGLAITKRLVELMRGRIQVSSEPDRGTTFTIVLPVLRAEASDISLLAHIGLIGLPQATQQQLVADLCLRNCQVEICDTPADTATPRPVLLIADEALPHLDPNDLTRRLSMGQRILVSSPSAVAIQLPPHLHGDISVISGPLSPIRLLHALKASAHRHHGHSEHRLEGIRVLAAEDNPVNRLVLAQMLEQEGAIVLFAVDGGHALEQVRVHGPASFDIMLCDIQMPVMDGYQTAKALGHIAPTLPIIGLTAHAFDSAKQQARRAGMVGYVTKPYMLDTLVDEIRRYARRRPGDPAFAAEPAAFTTPLARTDPTMQHDTPDWQAMKQYFREQPQLLDRLIAMLSNTLTTIQADLDQAVQTQNLEALAKVAHNIKGTALNLHTPEMARLAVQTQEQARQMARESLHTAEALSMRLKEFIALAQQHPLHAGQSSTSVQ